MRYLYQPTAVEELAVRGRYAWLGAGDAVVAEERWERYRQTGTTVEVWRAEWTTAGAALLSHAVVSEEGVERLKLRWRRDGTPSRTLTLTMEAESVLVGDEGALREEALPWGYGLVAPLLSLARAALPFDLASERREVAMTYLVRPRNDGFRARPAKFDYLPLGLRDLTLKGETLRARGWRMEAPGLPPRELWFDRNGTCLAAGSPGEPEGRLVEWTRFP